MSLYAQDTSNLFLKKDWWPLLYFSVTESFNKFMKTMPSSPSKTHVIYNIFPDHTMPPTSPLSKHNTLVISRFLHIQTFESKDQGPHSDLNLGHRMRTGEPQETGFMAHTLLLLLSPFLNFPAKSAFSVFPYSLLQ